MLPENYAGFWRRFFSSLVDMLVINLLLLPIGWFFTLILLAVTQIVWPIFAFFALISTYLVYFFIYFFFLHVYSASPGELLLKIKVFDAKTNQPITKSQIIRRSIMCSVVNFGPLQLLLLFNMLLVIYSEKKQTIQDMLAGTVAISVP